MARRKAAGGTPATQMLLAHDIPHRLIEYTHHDHATDYGAEAARETGIDPALLFKTLIVTDGAKSLAVAVVPVSGHLDLKALAKAWGVKRAEMADPAAAQRASGSVLGGVSPLGMKTTLPTFIDASAASLPHLCVSAGKRGLQVELDPSDLARLTRAQFVPLAR